MAELPVIPPLLIALTIPEDLPDGDAISVEFLAACMKLHDSRSDWDEAPDEYYRQQAEFLQQSICCRIIEQARLKRP